MQRYHATNCNSAVNNNSISVGSTRDTSGGRTDSLASNFTVNSRRPSLLTPYKLKCDKEPLNSRLGPPDFHPQTSNCLEETLTKEYLQTGYRETVEGLEEAREITLSQAQSFTKPVLLKCREAIRKCLRAINESRAQKRKAGQVYGVPLSGLLLSKPNVFPEQKPCSDEFKKKWIEGLSQPHKRLRTLADHVPHGYRRKALFEVLIRNNVSLLRATWYIKVNYLNQIRPNPSIVSSGTLDKQQQARKELWTKDFVEYLQSLLDEFISKGNSTQYGTHPVVLDGEEPSLHFKWWYVVRLLHWHHAEGLLSPSGVIDWVLLQLLEKDGIEISQLLLPIIYGFLEDIVLSQTYVRTLANMTVRFIRDPSPGGSDLVDNSRRAYTTSALIEMLRYLIFSVPDTFVGIDCFPLPQTVISYAASDGSFVSMAKRKDNTAEVVPSMKMKGVDAHYQSLSLNHVVSSIQVRASSLEKAACGDYPARSVVRAVQELDKALVLGDISAAADCLFEKFCDGVVDECWVEELSPRLKASLRWIGNACLPFLCSIFFLFEWATCDYRDFRSAAPDNLKFSGGKDFSQVYIVSRILKQKLRELRSSVGSHQKQNGRQKLANKVKVVENGRDHTVDLFESPGPLHDIAVCWIDQHEIYEGKGSKRIQFLVVELIRAGVFFPPAYVRQLLSSGALDMAGSMADIERGRRHYHLLKQLPGAVVHNILQEAKIAEGTDISEVIRLYSNERRLLLNDLPKEKHEVVGKKSKFKTGCMEVKSSIASFLRFPNSSMTADFGIDESQGSCKKPLDIGIKIEVPEGTPGCEDCRKSKRQKLKEEKNSPLSDDEDNWWVRKGPKLVSSPKLDPPLKSTTKQLSKGRQKNVRKTQSLAQLATIRTDTNQVASTSHICDNKVGCANHRTGADGDQSKLLEGNRVAHEDIASIGKALKRLRLGEKKSVVTWLASVARQLLEESMKTSLKVHQIGRANAASEDRSSTVWKHGEEELSSILYMIDACEDPVSAAKLLLWLLPKIPSLSASNVHGGRSLVAAKSGEHHAGDVGESFILSSLRRYEKTIVAADLIPDVLSAVMQRVTMTISSIGRVPGTALMYSRYLLKKYGSVPSVSEWERTFKSTCDKRLASELDCSRVNDVELGYPLGIPAGVEDVDDFVRQKMNLNKLSRIGSNMREIVLRNIDEASQYFYGKERKAPKNPGLEKQDDGSRVAQQIVSALMECIRQTGGAAQEGDPSLVSSAVSAIVHSVGPSVAKMSDASAASVASGSLTFVRRILQIHISCLSLLKEALGQRLSRVFEIAIANEASSALAVAISPGKSSRNDSKCAAAVSALIIGAVVHGLSNLERMVSVFRLMEGLDVIQYLRSSKSNTNGNVRTVPVDVYVHWFRILIGNSRNVCDGLVAQFVGESHLAAFTRMQRLLPISLVFPPAYSIFAFVIWRPLILNSNPSSREDSQLWASLSMAISDAVKHSPFRNICLRDSQAFYDLVSAVNTDSEFASLVHGSNSAFFPLRGRLFFNAIIECKIPESGAKLPDNIVNLLDALQPAKFHWQWVELRLLLNEQAIHEKVETLDMNFAEAIRSASSVSENENNIIEIILTRLLVRPDAAPLFSELIHLLGKSLEDSMLMQVKWFLGGSDVLCGRKSVRQRLINIAESKGIPIKPRFWKPWGWSKKSDVTCEGEASEVTEKALVELVIPCIDRSSEDSRNSFASELIKQLNKIEQQINCVTRGTESSSSKSSNRKAMRVQRSSGAADFVVLSPATLRSSLSLRLRLLLRLFPSILTDGEPSERNMRHVLASVVLRLLGSRFVQDDADRLLYDRLLLLLHALLSSCHPSWLKTRQPAKDLIGFDREVLENLQNELDRMSIPSSVRWQIQSAMPILVPSSRFSISCQPPHVSSTVQSAQNSAPRSAVSSPRTASIPGKSKGVPVQQEGEMEIDPWTLLEDGTSLVPSSGGSSAIGSDHGNLRACSWLKGAVRVRRTDLAYIGAVDDDS